MRLQVRRDRRQRLRAIVVGKEDLEGVAGQHHKIEAPSEPDRARVAGDPLHASAARPCGGSLRHYGASLAADLRPIFDSLPFSSRQMFS